MRFDLNAQIQSEMLAVYLLSCSPFQTCKLVETGCYRKGQSLQQFDEMNYLFIYGFKFPIICLILKIFDICDLCL